jgi:predicted small secreted protein
MKSKGGIMKSLLLVVLVAVFITGLTGCNMLKGAGKDVENAGEGIQRTVDHND